MSVKKQTAERKLISFDWAMKSVLRQKSSFGILEGLISTILKENIKIDTILETESNIDWRDGRYVRTDIQAKNKKGDIYIVEIQYAYQINFFHRILYSASVAVKEYLKENIGYDKIKRVISITIAYSNLGVGNDYVYKGNNHFLGIHDNSELELHETQQKKYKIKKLKQIFPEYWIIRLKQYNDELNDNLDQWIYFFKNSLIKKDFTAKGLQKASERLEEIAYFKGDEHAYNEYIKFILDRNSQIAQLEDEKEEKTTLIKTIEEKD
ncbi:MAG: PD-(D/E)XK nuclease family transposase, partial [Sediminibacterium sp.]|nr:PD-(D/E)XK nuclease family transposase [Sediminibacterium sp.]